MNDGSGIDWEGAKRQPCPNCGRGPKDRTCGVTIHQDGSAVAHCFRCGFVQSLAGPVRAGIRRPRSSDPIRHTTLSEYGCDLWNSCRPISGEAAAYLEARRCMLPPRDGHLRWNPALRHPTSGLILPALVALVTDVLTGTAISLHRTWICADGKKAPVNPARMLLGNHRKAGGVVRLWPEECVAEGLAVCEGIETALSLARGFTPAWACLDAGNLAALPVMPGLSLVIGADYDEVGIAAARTCAERWRAARATARILLPTVEGTDWNDEGRGRT